MQGFFAPSCGPAVQSFSLALMPPTLGLRDLGLNVAVEMPCLELFTPGRKLGIDSLDGGCPDVLEALSRSCGEFVELVGA